MGLSPDTIEAIADGARFRPRSRRAGAAWVLAVALLCGCSRDASGPAPGEARGPIADLAGLGPEAAAELAELRGTAEALVGRRNPPAGETAAAWGALGHWYMRNGFPELAVSAYQRAGAAKLDDHVWHFYLSQAYAASGDRDLAAGELQKVVSLRPEHLPSLLALARLALADGRLEEADSWARRALEAAPDWPGTWLTLGRIALARAKKTEAVRWLEKASAAKLEVSGLEELLASARSMPGDPSDAGGGSPAPTPAPGLMLWARGSYAAATPALMAEVDAGSEPLPLVPLVHALQRSADRQQKLRMLVALLQRFPGRVPLLLAVMMSGIDCEAALDELASAVEVASGDAALHFIFGEALTCAGRFAEARTQLERALEHWPDLERASLLLARVLVASQPRDGARAVELLRGVEERQDLFQIESRAMVHAALDQVEEAERLQVEAWLLAQGSDNQTGAARAKSRLWRSGRGHSAERPLEPREW